MAIENSNSERITLVRGDAAVLDGKIVLPDTGESSKFVKGVGWIVFDKSLNNPWMNSPNKQPVSQVNPVTVATAVRQKLDKGNYKESTGHK